MNLRTVLDLLARGEITAAEAESRLEPHAIAPVEEFARLDIGRHGRKGVPEVVQARGKTFKQTLSITAALMDRTGHAIVSSLAPEDWQHLANHFGSQVAAGDPESGMLVVRKPGHEPQPTGGKIGILSAGTADVPVAEAARLVAAEMGCETLSAYDVGVAGVHRLAEPLREMTAAGAACLVVAAGMEGALPSVVAGLVSVPVIGLPTSTGYGLGGDGTAALLSMLQSCCPGLVVVNIDNGVGAGATAALIANRTASSC